ncbi:hypothetical protein C4D60_Mb08t15550 [Musa balbisiana]|uniref:Uncharacterized protein n=1 Tax=Musa balbisiana TaxID=52838 RepID=A0A4S8K403_MUSBA|nr:hypothetical protein C4D60_Mb08t15550 [Musa balbisiana]
MHRVLLLRRLYSSVPPSRRLSQSAAVAADQIDAAVLPIMPPFDYTPPPYHGPRTAEIVRKRSEFLSPSISYLYKNPLNIVDGKMQYLFDEDGRRYLDAFGGIATVSCGHCHPDIVEAIINQTKRLQHPTVLYLNHAVADFAEALASKFPGDLKAHQYRGIFGSDGEKYAKDVEEIIDYGTSGRVAGFISEAIQGVGGIMELAPGYLPAVYRTIKKAGGLFIADEVQAGFARTGSHFWGFEAHGVVPDIVTSAKGTGNGIPIGAVVTTPEIARVLTQRCYFNTFGGNPVCTAAGHAVLKVIEKENLQENALVVGSYLKDQLKALQDKHYIIGDVRGRGLMLGVELVTDRQQKTPAKTEILHAMEKMKDMGVLVGKGGFYGNVFRITPPLCFSKEDADFFVDVMDIALSKI